MHGYLSETEAENDNVCLLIHILSDRFVVGQPGRVHQVQAEFSFVRLALDISARVLIENCGRVLHRELISGVAGDQGRLADVGVADQDDIDWPISLVLRH